MRSAAAQALTIVILLTAACGPGNGSAPTVSSSAVIHNKLSVDGVDRSYRLFRPSLPSGVKVPLVIALHDLGATGEDIAGYSRYDDQATKGHFIVAYPDGIEGSWNAGSCCSPASTRAIDDVKFIRQMIDQIVGQQPVDRSRVFVTGFSNGAAMTYRIGCELADRIRAIAPVSGAMLIDACHPVRPVSVMEIHGSKDYAFPLDGSTVGIVAPSLNAEMEQWVALDGCSPNPMIGGNPSVKTSTWKGCRGSTAVKLELIDGGGHLWFARATADTWQFFSTH